MRPRTLIIFAKTPRAGRVKTRIGREIGMVGAAWWYRHQTARLLRRVGRDPRWRTVLAITPDGDAANGRLWPRGIRRIPQGGGDLGARMRCALAAAPGPALLIGSDIPGVTPADIAEGFAALGRRDAVIGPATDGGYWMIGFARPALARRTSFAGVRWSSGDAFGDTLDALRGLSVGYARTLQDVDTAADLRRAGADPGRAENLTR